MPAAYPLAWPLGWPRTSPGRRTRATFGKNRTKTLGDKRLTTKGELTLAEARDRLIDELAMLGARNEVLSTNLQLRIDGMPRSGQPQPQDPGAAAYFDYAGKPTVLACDKWDRVEDNIAAIAKHIQAMRGMDRWGVGSVEQAFTGYQALPAPLPWWQVLGLPHGHLDNAKWSETEIRKAWARASAAAHPDRPGGSHDKQAAVNAARDAGLEALRS